MSYDKYIYLKKEPDLIKDKRYSCEHDLDYGLERFHIYMKQRENILKMKEILEFNSMKENYLEKVNN